MAPLRFNAIVLAITLYFIRFAVGQIDIPDTPRCYFPDGSLRNSTDYQPCNNVRGQHSMCCAIANRGSSADICLSNGLCSGATADGEGRALWREGCTDPTWEDPACLKICLKKGSKYDWFSSDAPITLCQDGTVCCGGKVTGGKCCDAGEGVQLPTNFLRTTATVISTIVSSVEPSPIPTTKKTEGAATTGSAVSTSSPRIGASSTGPGFPSGTDSSPQITTPVGSNEPTSLASSSLGMPDTAKIAIGVGIPILVIGVTLVAFFIWRRRTKGQAPPVYEKNSKGPVEIGTSDNTYYTSAGPYAFYTAPKPPPPPPEHHVNVHELHS
ncbi:hypothetical protein TWF718_001320 [Orbilia javanica]|uniref:Uncharacterized protein n=1 Tax=Orbilia javanica TaxID=47235 RepID=A0AAN8N8J7_9PEZI